MRPIPQHSIQRHSMTLILAILAMTAGCGGSTAERKALETERPGTTLTLPLPSTSPSPSPSPSELPVIGTVTYAQVNAQVFARNCVMCHGRSGGVNLESYDSILQVLSRVQDEALVQKSMPPNGPLSDSDQLLLSTWIQEGAPR